MTSLEEAQRLEHKAEPIRKAAQKLLEDYRRE
jgi:hypothetical protein